MSDEITVIRVVIPDAKIVRINVSSLSSGGTSFVADVPLVLAGGHLSIPKSDAVTDGYLDNADWSTFNGKVSSTRSISTTAPISGGGDLSADRTLSMHVADASHDGYLSSTDWTTFNGKLSPVFFNPGGRLTTESGVPVSTSDRTSQGTLYYTPYKHNNIYTYSGSAWVAKTFSEISLSLTLTSGKNYDVFINSAATTLSLSAAWASDSTRTDALGTQDGVTVLSSDHTKLWLGTIRASGANVIEDSAAKRFVWNAYNAVTRNLYKLDTSDPHTYGTAIWREWNGGVGGPHRISFVTGAVQGFTAAGWAQMAGDGVNVAYTAIGLNSTTADDVASTGDSVLAGNRLTMAGTYQSGVGFNELSMNEYASTGGLTFAYYAIDALTSQ